MFGLYMSGKIKYDPNGPRFYGTEPIRYLNADPETMEVSNDFSRSYGYHDGFLIGVGKLDAVDASAASSFFKRYLTSGDQAKLINKELTTGRVYLYDRTPSTNAYCEIRRLLPSYLYVFRVGETSDNGLTVSFVKTLIKVSFERDPDDRVENWFGENTCVNGFMNVVTKERVPISEVVVDGMGWKPKLEKLDESELIWSMSDWSPRYYMSYHGEREELTQKEFLKHFTSLSPSADMYRPGHGIKIEDPSHLGYLGFVMDVIGDYSFSTLFQTARAEGLRGWYLSDLSSNTLKKLMPRPDSMQSVREFKAIMGGERAPAKVFGVPKSTLHIVAQAVPYCNGGFYKKMIKPLTEKFGPQVTETCIKALIPPERTEHYVKVYDKINVSNYVEILIEYGDEKLRSLDPFKLVRYITEEVDVYQGIENPGNALQLLKDYYRVCGEMEVKVGERFPRSLKLTHDIAMRNYKLCLDEISRKKFVKAVEKEEYQKLEYKNDDYCVLIPHTPDDLVEEGRRQSHCVGSYVNYVSNGEKRICFMRKTSDPTTPVITLDVNKAGQLTQYRGFDNRDATETEMAFIRKWAKAKGLRVA